MSQEIIIEFKVAGVDAVNDAFSSIGDQTSECSGAVDAANSEMASSAMELNSTFTASAEDVNQAFGQVGRNVDQTRQLVVSDSDNMSISFRNVGRDISSFARASDGIARLGEQFGFLNDTEVNALKTFGDIASVAGSVIHTFGLLADASWAITLAEKARSIAETIANALAGPWGWAIIAGAAAAAVGGLALASQIPGHAEGGLIERPTLTWVGEKEPELIIPVSKFNVFVANTAAEFSNTVSQETTEISRFNRLLENPLTEIGSTARLEHVSEFNTFIEDTALKISKSQEHVTESLVSFSTKLEENIVTATLKHQEEITEFSTTFTNKIVGAASNISDVEGLGLYKKASPLEFLTGPLAGAKAAESSTETFNVQIVNPVFRSRSDLDYLIDRLKRMGMA